MAGNHFRAAIAAVLQFRRVRTGLVRPARRAALDRAVPVSACPRARQRCLPLCTSSLKKAKKTGRARGNVFAGGATSTPQPSGLLRYPRTTQVLPTPRMPPATLMPTRPPTIPSAGGAGLTGNLGTIYTGASETGTFARLDDSGAEFAGSGSKEDYYDFGLNYGGDASPSSTSDGLVRHRHRKGERKSVTPAPLLPL